MRNLKAGFETLKEMVDTDGKMSMQQLLHLYGKLCVFENAAFQINENKIAYATQSLKEMVEEKIINIER